MNLKDSLGATPVAFKRKKYKYSAGCFFPFLKQFSIIVQLHNMQKATVNKVSIQYQFQYLANQREEEHRKISTNSYISKL